MANFRLSEHGKDVSRFVIPQGTLGATRAMGYPTRSGSETTIDRHSLRLARLTARCSATCWLPASMQAGPTNPGLRGTQESPCNHAKKFDVPVEGLNRSVDVLRPAPALGSTDRRGSEALANGASDHDRLRGRTYRLNVRCATCSGHIESPCGGST